eukprot:g5364.t1
MVDYSRAARQAHGEFRTHHHPASPPNSRQEASKSSLNPYQHAGKEWFVEKHPRNALERYIDCLCPHARHRPGHEPEHAPHGAMAGHFASKRKGGWICSICRRKPGLRPPGEDEDTIANSGKASSSTVKLLTPQAIIDITIYFLFMAFFVASELWANSASGDMYFFGSKIREQYTQVEFRPEDAFVKKTFDDIATVQELRQWMLGPFVSAAYSAGTFDGDEAALLHGPAAAGYGRARAWDRDVGNRTEHGMLGRNRLIGGIRIGQLRSKLIPCSEKYTAPPQFRVGPGTWDGGQFFPSPSSSSTSSSSSSSSSSAAAANNNASYLECLAVPVGAFDRAEEPRAAYGGPLNQSFRFGGVSMDLVPDHIRPDTKPDGIWVARDPPEDVEAMRKQRFSGFQSRYLVSYPVPAYSVLLPGPDQLATAKAKELINYNGTAVQFMRERLLRLLDDGYIDRQTVAITFEFTYYNPSLRGTCAFRATVELGAMGGAMPSHYMYTYRLYRYETGYDYAQLAGEAIVAFFYLFYIVREVVFLFRDGVFFELLNFTRILHRLNLIIFVAVWAVRVTAFAALPGGSDPFNTKVYFEAYDYLDYLRPSLIWYYARNLNSLNTFLVWFKLVSFLSYVPRFALLQTTLAMAARNTAAFVLIFAIQLLGFVQAYVLCFGTTISDFRTTSKAAYALLNSLLGDFDFWALEEKQGFMGPVLFIFFTLGAVFVYLNVLIALISDSFEGALDVMEDNDALYVRNFDRLEARATLRSGTKDGSTKRRRGCTDYLFLACCLPCVPTSRKRAVERGEAERLEMERLARKHFEPSAEQEALRHLGVTEQHLVKTTASLAKGLKTALAVHKEIASRQADRKALSAVKVEMPSTPSLVARRKWQEEAIKAKARKNWKAGISKVRNRLSAAAAFSAAGRKRGQSRELAAGQARAEA